MDENRILGSPVMEIRSKGRLGLGESGDQQPDFGVEGKHGVLRESFGVSAVPWFDGHCFALHCFPYWP